MQKISFSVIEKTSHNKILTKIISLENNKIKKDSSHCKMSEGILTKKEVTIPRFKFLLKTLSKKTNFALVHGISDFDSVKIVSQKKFKKEEGTITRTKENIYYPKSPGILMFDYDSGDFSYSPDELLNILSEIHPDIENSSKVINYSSSSFIFHNGENKTGNNFHIYLFPKQANDIPRYLQVLKKRLFLAGYGNIKITKSGAAIPCTIIDTNVGSPERLDFVASPILKGDLTQDKPLPKLIKGELLNTKSLKDLTKQEEKEYRKIIEKLKNGKKQMQKKIKNKYLKEEVQKLINAGKTKEKAKEIVKSRQDHFLDEEDLLYFSINNGKPITVEECWKNKNKYDQEVLSDPLEPDYDNGSMTKAIFFKNGTILSKAHGGIKYSFKNFSQSYLPDTSADLKDLNKEFAVSFVGDKFKIIREAFDYADKKHMIYFLSKTAFCDFFANKKGWIETKKGLKEVPLAKLWLEWNGRRAFNNVVFEPGNNISKCSYNLFRGFPINPKKGSWKLLKNHIRDVLCNENEDYMNYLLDWMARIVQDPGGERPGVAVVLKGGKGVGKGIFANYFGKIFGESYMPIATEQGFIGKFNMHLSKCILVFLDEAVWSGAKQNEGQLKALITEPKILFEPKGIDSITLNNHMNIIMASNNDWVCPASSDERRFFVLEPNNSKVGDIDYFYEICKERDNGGVEALYYDLLQREYDIKKLRIAPKTNGLLKQIEIGLDDVSQFWRSVLDRQFLLTDENDKPIEWKTEVYKHEIYKEFCKFYKHKKFKTNDRLFWRKTWKLFGDATIKNKRKHGGLRYIYFDKIKEMKKQFTKQTGIKFEDFL